MNGLLSVALVLTTSYVAWFIERHERQVVYPFDSAYSTPAEAGEARLVESRYRTSDGAQLVVWQAAAPEGRPTVLYLPGNAGTLADRAWRHARLIDEGYGVVAPAYRGSSGSTGKPDEATLTSDAMELAEALVLTGPLILYGESLGSAVATKLAAAGIGDALILEAPFTSIPDLVTAQYPTERVSHLLTQVWESKSWIRGVRQPLLIVHGEEDTLVPPDMGAALHDLAPSRDKALFIVPGQGHHAMWTEPVQARVFAFLSRF